MNVVDILDVITSFIIIVIAILLPFNILYYIRNSIFKEYKEKTPFFRKPIFWLFISLLILPIINGIGSLYYIIKADIYRKKIYEIIDNNLQIKKTADNFVLDFITDAEKAEDFYNGKIIQITGIVDYIDIPKGSPSIMDNSAIIFSVHNDISIMCSFTNNSLIQKLKYNKENTIMTIVGIFSKNEARSYKRYIYLDYCEIIEE